MSIFDDDNENLLEMMEFEVGANTYGINIAKVREVVQYSDPTPSPDQHPYVEGILMLRGKPIPIIDLSKRLGTAKSSNPERDLFIISTFNKLVVGLHVHKINGIKKKAWSEIEKPSETISRYNNCIVTGIVNMPTKIVVLLDFEKIVADINPVTSIQVSQVTKSVSDEHKSKPIMIVDDSQMLNKLIRSSLEKAGFTNIVSKADGKEAWDTLFSYKGSSNISNLVSLVISDIEMPIMDGLTLCRKIKDDDILCKIPVVLFSSITDESTHAKGLEAGADAHLSKPQIDNLVNILEELL